MSSGTHHRGLSLAAPSRLRTFKFVIEVKGQGPTSVVRLSWKYSILVRVVILLVMSHYNLFVLAERHLTIACSTLTPDASIEHSAPMECKLHYKGSRFVLVRSSTKMLFLLSKDDLMDLFKSVRRSG